MKRFLALATLVATTGMLLGAGLAGASGAADASAGGSHLQPGGTIIKSPGTANSALPTISYNWSGYAATSPKKFTYVHSQFVQPAITCTGHPSQYTSNWVGLDGFDDQTVEQDGTFAWCPGPSGTTAVYYAWYEMYPAGSVNVFKVQPGDVIDEAVKYTGGKFDLSIGDVTSGKHVSISRACATCERTSAEWIIERPALCNSSFTSCYLTALADYHTATMSQDQAQLAGGAVKGIGGFTNYQIFIVNPLKTSGFISLDAVGPVSGGGFTATWERPGTTLPITLGPRR